MLVEFSIIPLGRSCSIGRQVARALEIVDASGLPYKVNPMGTVVEGSWDDIMRLIKKCHAAVSESEDRVVTTITVDDRKGKTNRIDKKVKSLEKRVGKSLKK